MTQNEKTWQQFSALQDSINAKNKPLVPTTVLDSFNNETNLLELLLNIGEKQTNLKKEELLNIMDRIGYHESKNNPKQISIIDYDKNKNPIFGNDKGMFQYGAGKNNSAWTASNRLKAVLNKRDLEHPAWLDTLAQNNYDMSTLSKEKQQILFMADKLKREGNPMQGVDEPDELLDFWLNNHWQGASIFPNKVEIRTNSFKDSMIDYDNKFLNKGN